jgi:hypothetical protein
MRGRLNSFQRAMLDWSELSAYNAVHVVRLSEALDLTRLRHTIQTTLASLGLTNLSMNRARGTFEYLGGPVVSQITVLDGGGPADCVVTAETERQLNTPFPRSDSIDPFRFFVVRGQPAFFLGLVYFHPVADAESVVWLLRQFVEAYRAGCSSEPGAEVAWRPDELTSLPQRPLGGLASQLAALPALVKMLGTGIRPRLGDGNDSRNGLTQFTLQPAALGWMRATGRAWGVTFNDLCLALLMRSLAPLATIRRQAMRRRMAVGCVVNVRRDMGLGPAAFGLFLGSFMVLHEVTEDSGLKELTAAINAQTARIKARRLYSGSPALMAFAGSVLRGCSAGRRQSLYQQYCPLWGGITNMNVNALWDEQDRSLDYLRAVSTGPVTPLMLSVTTARERLNVSLSYRTAVFSTEEIGQLQRRLLDGVTSLANPA